MTCISNETHKVNAVSVLWGRVVVFLSSRVVSTPVDGVDDWSYFGYVFGVVNGVFLNEHLAKRNAEIAKNARYLKKQKEIQNTWTTNCKVFIKLNGPPKEAKGLVIRDVAEPDKYQ